MHPRVTAILVAHSGAEFLERTLAALDAQTRRPDAVIAVNIESRDASAAILAESGPTHLISAKSGTTFGAAVSHALHVAAPPASDNEWLWLIGHDNAPDPDSLAQLLAAMEIAPSVAIAGPKLMRWEGSDVIAAFGETISTLGASVPLVEGELDQAQHDGRADVLGVAAGGMLVRRSVWTALGGFDPGLPSIDASLDFSIRARLAGHRVVLVPAAKVASASGPELFGRRTVSPSRRFRIARAAQLHRRLVYAPAWAVPIHWLSLVPLAILRSLIDLLAKRPGRVGAEFSAAFSVAFTKPILAARRQLRRTRKVGWGAIAPLRMPLGELMERRAQAREGDAADFNAVTAGRAGFVTHGGLWVVLLAGIVGLFSFGSLLGATTVTGGGLLPLSDTVPELWAQLGHGWRDIGPGFIGAADPFTAVLAVLGSITFWAPSYAIVLLYLAALPLAALGAWALARHLSRAALAPALAALVWALAPPLLSSLAGGHLGAVIAHLMLPWLVLMTMRAPRSWAAGAGASLVFAVVAASAPILVPALLALWLAWIISQPRSAHRLLGIPIPALALFAPLIVQQVVRGTPLGLLADPGVPVPGQVGSAWRLALGDAGGTMLDWPSALLGMELPDDAAPYVVAALLAPLAVLALLALFLPGSRRAAPAMGVALLGFLTSVAAVHLEVASVGAHPIAVWPASALSLYWLGLIAAAVIALESLGRAAVPTGMLAGLAGTAVALPLLGAMIVGTAAVQPGIGRILPALVTAEAKNHASIGTLVIDSEGEAGIAARLQRGAGTTLDDQSTLSSTAPTLSDDEKRIATLAGNLAARSGYDAATDFSELNIGFVVLGRAAAGDDRYRVTAESLDSNELLTPVGNTANGLLWRYEGETDPLPTAQKPTATAVGKAVLISQGVVFGIALLLAIPTPGGRRRAGGPGPVDEARATTFDEEHHG